MENKSKKCKMIRNIGYTNLRNCLNIDLFGIWLEYRDISRHFLSEIVLIRSRAPLSSITIYRQFFLQFFEDNYQEMIKNEMNITSLELVNRLEDNASLELKLNFPLLGNKIPEKKIKNQFNMLTRKMEID